MGLQTPAREAVHVFAFTALAIWCIGMAGCDFQDDRPSRQEVNQQLGRFSLTIPSSAKGIRSSEKVGLDTIVIVRFEIPQGELDGVLTAMGFPNGTIRNDRCLQDSDVPSDTLDWWRPDSLKNVKCAEWDIPGSMSRKAIAGNIKGIAVVYIECFTV
jgi:hypothetical protein